MRLRQRASGPAIVCSLSMNARYAEMPITRGSLGIVAWLLIPFLSIGLGFWAADSFAAGASQHDNMTLIVARVL